MDYRELWEEENGRVARRYSQAMGEVGRIQEGNGAQEPFGAYFASAARFLKQIEMLVSRQLGRELDHWPLERLQELNHALYEEILPDHYGESFADPAYAARLLGAGHGPLLSAFYAQLRSAVVFAYECRMADITLLAEALVGLCHLYEGEAPEAEAVRSALCDFYASHTDEMVSGRLREQLDPGLSFALDIIMESDLSDLRYLYRFGEYISDAELETASFLSALPQETIDRMADTYTEGFRKGFEVMGRDLSKKSIVSIRYELGFERMIRAAVLRFGQMGLEPVIYRRAAWSVAQAPNHRAGYHGASVNRQYDYDHRYDQAVYFDEAFKERKLAALRAAYETYRGLAVRHAGPAVLETFGEDAFHPVNKPEALALSKKQEESIIAYSNESMLVTNEYMPKDETSFTIIAFPVPAIGKDYEKIFAETIRINTLDYEVYKTAQQRIIDVLDQAACVHVTGRGGNETDIMVRLHTITDPGHETNFENCVADVNIPVGEVFTSPLLAGTNGLVHVGKVYLGDIQFHNLRLKFADGKVVDYSCDNFEDPEEGRALVRQEILKNHEYLPLGEFAIGTNTAAYAMAEKYQIVEKLPILIAEKMGPHFAVGDTCYSWSEDSPMYNPDGKEVIARDNEISLLRKEDASKAYFGCHTDITIPYSELGDIDAVCPDGRKLPVIRQGRFAVEGTEVLNQEL